MKLHRDMLIAIIPLILAGPTNAILGGDPDGNAHPYVGALDVRPTGLSIPCTGTLVSATVYVTAGHCANFFLSKEITRARVTFDPVFSDSAHFHTGTLYLHPQFRSGPQFSNRREDPHDIAVLVFDAPIMGINPAQLPSEALLDDLGPQGLAAEDFPVVGYGISRLTGGSNGGGPPDIDRTSAGTRRTGTWEFLSITSDWLRFDMDDAQGCVGDSGAPNLLGDSDIVVGIGIGGDSACQTMGSDLRLDTPSVREFLGQFVTLP